MNKSTSFQPVGSIVFSGILTPPLGVLSVWGGQMGKRNVAYIWGRYLMADQWQVRLMHSLIQVWFLILFSFPTVNAEHIASRGININTVALVDCILQILFSSYQISLSFNQSFVAKIRSISISSPCHFYFVLYCFI